MTTRRILVADRSTAVRAVLRRLVEADRELVVVAEATDGPAAIELIHREAPDALVVDVDLPGLADTPAATEVFGIEGPPIVVVTACRDPERTNAAFRALRAGIVGVFAKPNLPSGWEAFGDTLRETLRQLARDRSSGQPVARGLPTIEHGPIRCVAIGASTGGPAALARLLQPLGRRFPAPVVVVQHIAAGFEAALGTWLAGETGLDVGLAVDGERPSAGSVRIGPTGLHLEVNGDGVTRLDATTPPRNGHRPAADVLFRSLRHGDARQVVAVLLSGMGSDGVAGMEELRQAGSLTLVQDESSSAVWGMPRAALERGAARIALPPAEIGALLSRLAVARNGR